MKDQKEKQSEFIFHSNFWSYLPGVWLILGSTVPTSINIHMQLHINFHMQLHINLPTYQY